ncbi:hypothetical protein MtrunA17_Chr7g0225051 [Medicago truncatula]|uniref:Uncharacterized protein n=1 Tax=Medicago truncatula TaxID=3880 RepID=A0A396H237_MEDTR|nr:hypothetical protein MtrunA17_Chr7g0225051 [Medicago truncatula]
MILNLYVQSYHNVNVNLENNGRNNLSSISNVTYHTTEILFSPKNVNCQLPLEILQQTCFSLVNSFNKKGVGLLLHDPEIERIACANRKVVRQLMFLEEKGDLRAGNSLCFDG